MKKLLFILVAVMLVFAFAACDDEMDKNPENPSSSEDDVLGEDISATNERKEVSKDGYENASEVVLSNDGVTVDGKSADESNGVVVGGEIIYYHDMEEYPSGNKYGNGDESDKHTEEEAAQYTLVTITKPGEYFIRGELKGQLAIDLGDEAEKDPDAKVTLIFGGADITCDIAPAVIFYNVYECDALDKDPTKDVDTSNAGANVIIADGSVSNINGANVAKIYKDNGEEKKLHKYDGAFYSKMSMNIDGGDEDIGVLNINGKNEGLDSELHLTLNGGIININSADDGINTNEDGISVTTVNGGKINIVGGTGSEGDGIDSNGWLVINGGEIYSSANGKSGDGGLDADNGIYINGGKVFAVGSRNDSVNEDSEQLFVTLEFNTDVAANSSIEFVDADGKGVSGVNDRACRSIIISDESFEEGKEYSLYVNGILQEYSSNVNIKNAIGQGISEIFNFAGEKPEMPEDDKNSYEAPKELEAWLESEKDIPDEIRTWIEKMADVSEKFGKGMGFVDGITSQEQPQEPPKDENEIGNEKEPFDNFFELEDDETDRTVFVVTKEKPSFYGVSDSVKGTGKEEATFTVNGKTRLEDIYAGDGAEISSIECSKDVPKEQIKLTLIYSGRDENINVSRSCLLSEGYEKVNSLFEELSAGDYRLIIEITEDNEQYRGIQYFNFDVVK